MQLAVYLGWMLNGVAGGLAAGLLFVLPGFLAIMLLSVLYALLQGTGHLAAIPLIWSVVGLNAAVYLGIYQDYGLFLAGLSSAWLILYRGRKSNYPALAGC